MLVSFKDYSFTYADAKTALTNINLNIKAGSFTVMFGRSGSGKTTLLRQLKSVLLPSGTATGSLLWHDQPLAKLDNRQQASAIGYVNQQADAQFVTDKVWHELAFGLESLGEKPNVIHSRIAEMATFFGLTELMSRDVTTLSGGQKQLVSLASVMVMRPELLLLDEPTAQLDPLAKQSFIQALVRLHNELGTTILLAEHELEDVTSFADQLVMMRSGAIVADGAPQQVSADLFAQHAPLFAALPTATRLYCNSVTSVQAATIPLTVGAGRAWLQGFVRNPEPFATPAPEPDAQPWLIAKHVSFRYSQDAPDTLKDINLQVSRGQWYGIVGSNGAGKTTLLNLLGRILRPSSGKITLASQPLDRYRSADLYQEFLAVMPQDPTTLFASATVQAELMTTAKRVQPAMGAEAAVSGVIDLCHLRPLLAHHPFDLSGGERQLLALAKIILLRPKVLLLDEPTKGLDAFTKAAVGSILAQLHSTGVTIVMVTHDLDFVAQYADHIALLFDGEIAASAPTHEFFAANSFYTTTANRIARDYWPNAITLEEVEACLQKTNS
ncbi:ABC transporter ATP-binding protein [Lacticaseibacillus hulanensis]|uniref:ABC transporter ATP-binding protein n=1 Tax=Lacticaseibacillus hulanensis TaxID=2493111 RepID=UPI000FDA8F05|nr:ATP-binding cassette domain-containing protein [Lacticaseibacillus hulanensis]